MSSRATTPLFKASSGLAVIRQQQPVGKNDTVMPIGTGNIFPGGISISKRLAKSKPVELRVALTGVEAICEFFSNTKDIMMVPHIHCTTVPHRHPPKLKLKVKLKLKFQPALSSQ